jgi:hypothetical protein
VLYVYGMSTTAPCFCELCLPDWQVLDIVETVPTPKRLPLVLDRNSRQPTESAERRRYRLTDLGDLAERDSDSG